MKGQIRKRAVVRSGAAGPYKQPGGTAFNWLQSAFNIAKIMPGGAGPVAFDTSGRVYDVANFKPSVAAGVYYVNFAGANDGNSGADAAHSLASLATAIGKADAGIIYLGDTANAQKRITRVNWGGNTLTKSLIIIGVPSAGRSQVVCGGEALTWSLVGGTTSTYTCSRTAVLDVRDAKTLDANGDYTQLVKDGSWGGGELAAGHYYYSSPNLTVRAPDSRNLVGDQDIWPILSSLGFRVSGANSLYLENIDMECGSPAFSALATDASHYPTVLAKNCTFANSGNANAAQMQGSVSLFQNCTAKGAYTDGFNYHALAGSLCKSVEIACIGRDNGWSGGDANNGTTTHDGNSHVVIGGSYMRNDGPNVIPVNDGTTMWGVGITAYDSTGVATNANYESWCTTTGGMWLDSCASRITTPGAGKYDRIVLAASYMHCRRFTGTGSDSNSGTLDTY